MRGALVDQGLSNASNIISRVSGPRRRTQTKSAYCTGRGGPATPAAPRSPGAPGPGGRTPSARPAAACTSTCASRTSGGSTPGSWLPVANSHLVMQSYPFTAVCRSLNQMIGLANVDAAEV